MMYDAYDEQEQDRDLGVDLDLEESSSTLLSSTLSCLNCPASLARTSPGFSIQRAVPSLVPRRAQK